jgi:long-chain acyl-CoA synthetase
MTLLYDWLKKAAKAQGNNKAVVYRDNYLSWRGLLHRVDRRAQEFKSMGIKEGAWVGLMLGNVPDFVILALALSKLDAAIVPIDPTTGGRELELILAAAPLRALVTRPRGSEGSISANGTSAPVPPSTLPRSRVQRPTTPPRDGTPPPTPSADAAEVRRRLQGTLLTCSVYKRSPPDHGVDPIAVLFTSDSLGDPKGVLRTDKNTIAAVDHTVAALGMSDKTKLLVAVPLFHAYGWDLGFLPTLKLGATMLLEEEISARRIGKLVREHDVDILPGTPPMYAELSKLPTAKKVELKAPRYLSAGSRLDQTVADGFFDQYGVRLQSCYHSTEAATVTLEDSGKYPTTVGKPIDGVEIRITSPDGSALKAASAKEGLIWVKSKTLSPKSIGPFDAESTPTARASGMVAIGAIDKAGWLRTGDLGKLDKNGRLMLTGREDDVVKVDGKRVALGEVEGCLEAFPKIKAAQATVVTDPMAGAMVVARVVMKQKCGAEEIIDHCARNLAPYKVPRRIEFCDVI